MNDQLATIYARTADATAGGWRESLSTRIEITRLRMIERARALRLLWLAMLALVTVLTWVGVRGAAARFTESGQRSCPHAGLRRRFGRRGLRLLPELSVTPHIQADRAKIFGQSRVSVLKPYLGPSEPGIVHLKFSEVITALPSLTNVRELSRYFRLVLEPSWTGLCDPGVLQYLNLQRSSVVMAPERVDFEFIESIGGRLVPVNLGPCDWVDPRVAEPFLGSPKQYDIVVNSNWAPWKRHELLFAALSGMQRSLRVALIGGTWDGGTLERIFRLARYYGVHRQLTAFQFIPFPEVMRVVSASRCSVLLSLKEGANRSLAESMFCNVPVLLLDEHVGGIRKNVVEQTGVVVPQARLRSGLETLLASADARPVREWALQNISCLRSSETLNAKLREVALAEGEQWRTDIAVRSNSPESTYYREQDLHALAADNECVLAFLRGTSARPVLPSRE